MLNKLTIIALTSFLLLVGVAQAQIITGQLAIDVTPASPQPGQEIQLKAVSSAFDLTRSTITWLKDGQVVLKGLGETTYFFTAGKFGERTMITLRVDTLDGVRLENSRTITVAEVVLIWSAFTTIPPGYKGKAISSPNSLLRVTAIPFIPISGKGIESKARLIFNWFLDGEIRGLQSGTGKDFFEFRTGLAPSSSVSVGVKVENLSKSMSIEREIVIPIQNTEIVLYESSLLLGPKKGRAVESIILKSNEEKRFSAQPYFFDSTKSSTLKTRWLLEDQALPTTPNQENVVVVKAPSGVTQAFQQQLTVIFSNARNIFQETRKNFTLNIQP